MVTEGAGPGNDFIKEVVARDWAKVLGSEDEVVAAGVLETLLSSVIPVVGNGVRQSVLVD